MLVCSYRTLCLMIIKILSSHCFLKIWQQDTAKQLILPAAEVHDVKTALLSYFSIYEDQRIEADVEADSVFHECMKTAGRKHTSVSLRHFAAS